MYYLCVPRDGNIPEARHLLSNSAFISNFPNLSVTSSRLFFCTITGRSGALGRSSTLSAADSALKYPEYAFAVSHIYTLYLVLIASTYVEKYSV